jgi:hypothetical protein
MGHYTLRLLSQSEQLLQAFEREYRNALDALDAAEALSSDGTVEVWSERGRIARVKRDNKPSGPEDALPG